MVVEAGDQHVVERDRHELLELLRAAAQIGAPQKLDQRHGREFLRAGEAAEEDVEALRRAKRDRVQYLAVERTGGVAVPEFLQLALDARHGGGDLAGLVAIGRHDVGEDGLERQLIGRARLLRDVAAGEERNAFGRQEHGQRPAAARAHRGRGVLIKLVDVGPLFAVDLHVDEALVHQRRGLGIGEALAVHHMAPMAGREPDGEKDGLAALLGRRQGFRPPRVPIHRIVLVQQKIGTGRLVELIAAHDGSWMRAPGQKASVAF